MRKFFAVITIMVAVFLAGPSVASDMDRLFIRGGGVGAVECSEFVEGQRLALLKGRGTVEYFVAVSGYIMFIQGYRTAFNEKQPSTYNIFPADDYETQLKWLGQWYGLFPNLSFADAVIALAQSRYLQRTQKMP